MSWSSRKKRAFLYRLFCPKGIFLRFVLSQCIVYWIHSQNIHTFTYQEILLHTLLLFVFEIVESLQCIKVTRLLPATLLEMNSWTESFSSKFCKISKNIFFTNVESLSLTVSLFKPYSLFIKVAYFCKHDLWLLLLYKDDHDN